MAEVVGITGASSGIGRATVRRCAGPGVRLALVAPDREAVEEALGPIDIWVNVAVTTVFAFLADVEPDELRRATDVTHHGSVWGIRAALKRMNERDRGTIVQVGSAMAYRGIPLQAPYCGATHLPGVNTPIWGNELAPWLAERYPARTAVSGQLSDARKRPDREDNLFEAPSGDPGAHGPYDDRAHARSLQLAATEHRRGALAAAAGALAVGGGAR